MKASWNERYVLFNSSIVKIVPGQFILGRSLAAKTLNMSERQIRTCIDTLVKISKIEVKTTNKYSIISIIKWDSYQDSDQQATSRRPASDQQATTKKKLQELKELKENKIQDFFIFPENYTGELKERFLDFIENRKALKKPVTEKAFLALVKKLNAISGGDEEIALEILSNSIESGWAGLFPLKKNGKQVAPKIAPDWY